MKRHLLVVNTDGQVKNSFIPFCAQYGDNWCISFCPSPLAAIEVCKNNKVDAVISDISETEFNVLDLLADVAAVDQNILRTVLVDRKDSTKYKNSLGLINAYLFKTYDHKTMDNVLERSIALHIMLKSEEEKGIVLESKLPSMPRLYTELLELLRNEDVELEKVANVISTDPAMTTKILHIVNSSFFALRREILNTRDAVVMLGLEAIKGLVLSQQIFSEFSNKGIDENLLNELWNHSVTTASIARQIAKLEGADKTVVDTAFTAGLLHDLGKLVMLEQLPQTYLQYVNAIVADNQDSIKVEKMIFNTDHACMGASLLKNWGIVDPIVEAVAFHHRPIWFHNNFSAVIAVHAADCLAHEFMDSDIDSLRMDPAALRTADVLLNTRKWREESKKCFS